VRERVVKPNAMGTKKGYTKTHSMDFKGTELFGKPKHQNLSYESTLNYNFAIGRSVMERDFEKYS